MRTLALYIAIVMAIPPFPTQGEYIRAQEKAPPVRCEDTLQACDTLVQAQKAQIDTLKQYTKALEQEVSSQSEPLIPTWLVFVGGMLVGGLIVGLRH